MAPIRIAVAGGGLIAQVEHVPNLLALPDHFSLAGLYDPSAQTRRFFTQRHGIDGFDSYDALLASGVEAVLIATPDAFHAELAERALAAGLHVFCEKPLAYGPAEIESLIAARDRAGRHLQIGYMKRFDPGVRLLLEQIEGLGPRLRFIGVEVNDPDAWPFVDHHATFKAQDLAPELLAQGRERQDAQVSAALGRPLQGQALAGFTGAYSSSLIHDLNLVHGILDHLGLHDRRARSGSFFSGGAGGSAVLEVGQGQALCHLVHVAAPALAEYGERVSLIFDDRRFELVFPSPYLNHQQTRLLSYGSSGHHLQVSEHRNGFQEAFVLELIGFHEAIRQCLPVRNTAEQALGDARMLADLAALALQGAQA